MLLSRKKVAPNINDTNHICNFNFSLRHISKSKKKKKLIKLTVYFNKSKLLF